MRHSLEILDKRLWLLPFFGSLQCRSDFAFFITYFVALATMRGAARSHDGVWGYDDAKKVAQMLRTRSIQVWELFPSFCTGPVKFVESFKVFAPVLGAAQGQSVPCPTGKCRGLCVLLASSTNEAEVKDSSKINSQRRSQRPSWAHRLISCLRRGQLRL